MSKAYRLRNIVTGWEGGVTEEIYNDRISKPEYEDAGYISSEPEYDNETLPDDIPHREYLDGFDNLAQVAEVEAEGGALEDISGIGGSRADDIRQYIAENV